MMEAHRRDVLRGGMGLAAAFLAMPAMARGSSAPPAPAPDPMTLVDPELRPFLKKALAPKPDAPPPLPRPARYRPDVAVAPFAKDPPVEERMVSGMPGQPPVRVYVIGRSTGSRKPAVLHIHGGGFVSGSAVQNVSVLQAVAKRLDCVIVTVDYRLAPETPLSGSLEDNYAALRWLHDTAASLGVDQDRIVVSGDSAGGGHAAMLAIAARDRGGPPIRAQILTYPMLDDRTGSTRAVPPFIGTYVWQVEDNRFGWSSLLGMPAGSANAPAHRIPGRVENLTGLPPAFIGTGSLDLFAAENMDYARRLSLAGVGVDLHVYPGAFHGFDIFVPDAGCSRDFVAARDRAYRRAFG